MATMSSNSTFQSTAPVVSVASFSFPLTILFFCVCCLAAVSLGRVIHFRHRLLSFQVAFLTLSFLWALMRGVMFLFLDLFQYRSPQAYRALLWIPLVLCVMAFSLLASHHASVLHHDTWEAFYRTRFMVGYCLFNGIFFVMHAAIFIWGALNMGDESLQLFLMRLELGLSALMFVVLGTVIAVQGFQLWNLVTKDPPAIARIGRRSTRAKLAAFVSFIVFVFASRALVNLLVAFEVISLSTLRGSGGFTAKQLVAALSYVLWEVIPIVVFTVMFWPRNTRDRTNTSGAPMPASQDLPASMANLVAAGNNTPIPIHTDEEVLQYHPLPRYDSDEDEPRFESTNSMYSPYSTTPKTLGATPSGGLKYFKGPATSFGRK